LHRGEHRHEPILSRHLLQWSSLTTATWWARSQGARWIRLVVGPRGCQELELASVPGRILPGYRVSVRAESGSLPIEFVASVAYTAATSPDPTTKIRRSRVPNNAVVSSGWYWGGAVKEVHQLHRSPWWARP
jgi:hypothetical protein